MGFKPSGADGTTRSSRHAADQESTPDLRGRLRAPHPPWSRQLDGHVVRVTDARMSGTSFGTCVLHVAPEAAVGGPLGLVRDGDPILLDVPAGRLELELPQEELAARRRAWQPQPS